MRRKYIYELNASSMYSRNTEILNMHVRNVSCYAGAAKSLVGCLEFPKLLAKIMMQILLSLNWPARLISQRAT